MMNHTSTLIRPIQASERLVVITGWLGCQPKQLKRYEEMYQKLGFRTHSRIATPTMIVQTCLDDCSSKIRIPKDLPPRRSDNSLNSVQDLAWDILARVHETQSTFVMFHVLSNGGCFVWEQIRQIIGTVNEKKIDNSESILPIVTQIHNSLRGVVFDSCPATDIRRIDLALEYCSDAEKADILRAFGQESLSFLKTNSNQGLLGDRSKIYLERLMDDDWPIPQLYLYSENDQLAKASDIDTLVTHRRDLMGSNLIWRRRWKESSHVSHIRDNPSDYREAVDSFVEFCSQNGTRSSL